MVQFSRTPSNKIPAYIHDEEILDVRYLKAEEEYTSPHQHKRTHGPSQHVSPKWKRLKASRKNVKRSPPFTGLSETEPRYNIFLFASIVFVHMVLFLKKNMSHLFFTSFKTIIVLGLGGIHLHFLRSIKTKSNLCFFFVLLVCRTSKERSCHIFFFFVMPMCFVFFFLSCVSSHSSNSHFSHTSFEQPHERKTFEEKRILSGFRTRKQNVTDAFFNFFFLNCFARIW